MIYVLLLLTPWESRVQGEVSDDIHVVLICWNMSLQQRHKIKQSTLEHFRKPLGVADATHLQKAYGKLLVSKKHIVCLRSASEGKQIRTNRLRNLTENSLRRKQLLLFVVCCLLFVVCYCLLFAVCCLLFVVVAVVVVC